MRGNPVKPRGGFTLIEMLVVVSMVGLLMTVSLASATKARTLVRRAKAEAELREMVNAWLQYQAFYGKWPEKVKGKIDVTASAKLLGPIIDSDDNENPLGVVFLGVPLAPGDDFLDPWGHPYRISFDKEENKIRRTTALETSIFIKYAQE